MFALPAMAAAAHHGVEAERKPDIDVALLKVAGCQAYALRKYKAIAPAGLRKSTVVDAMLAAL